MNISEEEKQLIETARHIYDDHLQCLQEWDMEFIQSVMNAIRYRRNKIEWNAIDKRNKKTIES